MHRDRPDYPAPPDRPSPGSHQGLSQRLNRLPPSHPSSPRYRGGEAAERVRVRDYGLPAERPTTEDLRRQDTQTDHGQAATAHPEWQGPLARGEVDRAGLGVVDERARQFLPGERRVAQYLAQTDGVAVVAFPEDHRARERQHDADVDGGPVEFKNLDPGASDATVKNTLRKSIGQAPCVVVDSRDSGLSRDNAERGLRRYLGTPWSKIDSIRIIGDDFDIRWTREENHGSDR